MRRILFWILLAVTLGVYLAMVTWTLPAITAEAGGLAPFDLRLGGYTFAEARAFLAALGPDGTALYKGAQHRLDIFFPGLVAATLYFAVAFLLPARTIAMRMALAAAILPVALFDWLENGAVATMLAAGAEGVTAAMVATANRWSVLKVAFSTAAYSALLALLVRWGWLRIRAARTAT